MSEYTWGVLFLQPNLSRVEQQMQGFPLPYITQELNHQWGVLFVEGDNYISPPVKPKLVEISRDVPLLYFQNSEDQGWGYSIYASGTEVASLWVSYDLDFNQTLDLAQQRYPEVKDYFVGFDGDIWQKLHDEVLNSSTYHNEVIQQYRHLNLQTLQVFGLDNTAIRTLVDAISPNTYFDHEKLHAQYQIFKETLGINEMAWASYHYVTIRRR